MQWVAFICQYVNKSVRTLLWFDWEVCDEVLQNSTDILYSDSALHLLWNCLNCNHSRHMYLRLGLLKVKSVFTTWLYIKFYYITLYCTFRYQALCQPNSSPEQPNACRVLKSSYSTGQRKEGNYFIVGGSFLIYSQIMNFSQLLLYSTDLYTGCDKIYNNTDTLIHR